jgi:ABC-type glycerol-3-phosphate transport system substrate-binding protein
MKKRIISISLVIMVVLSTFTFVNAADLDYDQYLSKFPQTTPQTEVSVNINSFTSSPDYAKLTDGGVYTGEDGYVDFSVDVLEEGFYNIEMKYYTVEGKGSAIVRSLYIDGQIPCTQAKSLTFTRAFVNASDVIIDSHGNQIRPVQIEKPMWLTTWFCDAMGYTNEPLKFYFTKGNHILRLQAVKEPVVIGSLTLKQYVAPPAYTTPTEKGSYAPPVYIQGEDAVLKSDSMLYPLTDNSSVATQPSSADKILLNTIGANKWSSVGQWLVWNFDVNQSGVYTISMRQRQNLVPGQASYRQIYIDDKVPCIEFNSYMFLYNNSWKITTLKNKDENYRFYLKAGNHTIKMQVVLGELSDVVSRVNDSIVALNQIYRDFLMIIGPNPDSNRDYQFKALLPNDLTALMTESAKLKEIYKDFVDLNGIGGSQAQILNNIAVMTEKLAKNPNKIASMFSDFSNNISALGTFITTAKNQPLEIDYIALTTDDKDIPKVESGFFSDFIFAAKQFIASFFVDYNHIGKNSDNEAIKVWITSGNDQANSLTQMSNNYFTPQTGINAAIQLVPANTLLTATLANKGPDVALHLGQSEPMNYAIRGAIIDISKFDGFDEVKKAFQPSAMTPLTFNNCVYGLPETQDYPVMFYRTDILDQLGLAPPETWDDVIAMLPILNKNNLNFGLPIPMATNVAGLGFPPFVTFLYQNGGTIYNKQQTKSALDSDAAINAFTEWTNFYTQYSLPYQYNFLNRFRSGEIPIGIADYGTYNAISVFAPELNGMWKFALVPGTRRADGSIDRTVASSIVACSIMANSKNKQNSWKFIKWWTSASAQEIFGREIESIMGTAARYQTANIEAMYQIPWVTSDFKLLLQQWSQTKGIPEIPGSYMASRYVDFGFKQVVLQNSLETDCGQILINQSKLLTEEIQAKRKEFRLVQ